MKTTGTALLTVILSICITSCSTKEDSYHQQAIEARSQYLAMTQGTAQCQLNADYGQRVYDFSMVVNIAQQEGVFTTELTLTAPEEIQGIQATQVGFGKDSKLLWEDMILDTGDLSQSGLSPVTAVPLLLETLCQGYIESVSIKEKSSGTVVELYCRNPEQALGQGQEIILWLDPNNYSLLGGEIFQDGVRVIACTMEQFIMN